jgi:hypothetical protein
MQPHPLTPQEVIAIVRRQVSQFEEVGMTHEAAVLMVALTLKVEPYKIAVLAPPLPGEDGKEQS